MTTECSRAYWPRSSACVSASANSSQAADVDALRARFDKHGLAFIEDVAHAPRATPVGSDTKLGAFGLAGLNPAQNALGDPARPALRLQPR